MAEGVVSDDRFYCITKLVSYNYSVVATTRLRAKYALESGNDLQKWRVCTQVVHGNMHLSYLSDFLAQLFARGSGAYTIISVNFTLLQCTSPPPPP